MITAACVLFISAGHKFIISGQERKVNGGRSPAGSRRSKREAKWGQGGLPPCGVQFFRRTNLQRPDGSAPEGVRGRPESPRNRAGGYAFGLYEVESVKYSRTSFSLALQKSSGVCPMGFGGDRKAPETGRVSIFRLYEVESVKLRTASMLGDGRNSLGCFAPCYSCACGRRTALTALRIIVPATLDKG